MRQDWVRDCNFKLTLIKILQKVPFYQILYGTWQIRSWLLYSLNIGILIWTKWVWSSGRSLIKMFLNPHRKLTAGLLKINCRAARTLWAINPTSLPQGVWILLPPEVCRNGGEIIETCFEIIRFQSLRQSGGEPVSEVGQTDPFKSSGGRGFKEREVALLTPMEINVYVHWVVYVQCVNFYT